MRSQKGIAMTNIVIYIICFLLITSIIGIINNYFYKNIKIVDSNIASSAEYNKLNMYLLNQTKSDGVKILSYTDSNELYLNEAGIILNEKNSDDDKKINYVTFELKDGTKNTFVKLKDILYFNQIKLCDEVEDFTVNINNNGTKDILSVKVQISNKQYLTEYVLNS